MAYKYNYFKISFISLLLSVAINGAEFVKNADPKDTSQYQGSQAFNLNPSTIESVNPNTGSFGITTPLISQPGITSGVNLGLNLVYSLGSSGRFGLPNNWVLDIAYVIPGKSLTYKGRNYVIDNDGTWQDQSGYKSGLRYINNHGLRFDASGGKLPGNRGAYQYSLTAGDGSCDYFDTFGNVIEHDDRFGNYISYSYSNNLLNIITDSYKQQYQFYYSETCLTLVQPNKAKTLVYFTTGGVSSIIDALGNTTSFLYDGSKVSTINYPTGLTTIIQYNQQIPYYSSPGETQKFLAVTDIIHQTSDQSSQNRFIDQTKYIYAGEILNGYFTGYNENYILSATSDGLMDSNNVNYAYEVLVAKMDATGQKYLAATRTYYNYLHLPTRIKRYTDLAWQNWYQTDYTYLAPKPWFARTTNYDKPVQVVSSIYQAGQQALLLHQTSSIDSTPMYDDFGNLLQIQKSMYDNAQKKFIPQNQKTMTWQQPTWIINGNSVVRTMPQSVTSQDLLTGHQRQETFTLAEDGKSVASKIIAYQNQGDQNWNAWKTSTLTYDPQGRLISTQKAWTHPEQHEGIASTTSRLTYSSVSDKGILTVTHTDDLGHSTVMEYDVTIPDSPLVSIQSPMQQIITHDYDILGRATKSVEGNEADGHVYTTQYKIFATDSENSVTTTAPVVGLKNPKASQMGQGQFGYIKKSVYDELGRLVRKFDNGDPTKDPSATPSRLLGSTTYNAIGKVYQSTDRLGLTTTSLYDMLGRRIQVIDPLGNVVDAEHDDMQLAVTTKVNGILRSKSVHDAAGHAILRETYPDSSDTSQNYFLRRTHQYNGLGKVLQTNLYKVVNSDVTPLTQKSNLQFNADGRVVQSQFVGYLPSGKSDQVTTSRVYDLQGKGLHSAKQVTYADGRNYKVNSTVKQYDTVGKLLSETNQLNQVESYTYNDNGNLKTHTRYDGTIFTYQYDYYGNLSSITWVEDGKTLSTNYTYNEDNSLQKIWDVNSSISYDYYLDGKAKSVQYPNVSQQYIRDPYSRLVTQIDPSGAKTVYAFDPKTGQAQTVQQGTELLTYVYGNVNHKNGVLTNVRFDSQQPWAYSYNYNGWDRLSSATVYDGNNTLVLSSSQTYDELGRISVASKASPLNDNNMNWTKTTTYDGLSQLSSVQTTYTSGAAATAEGFTYDGNNNVLTHTVGTETTEFAYNALDQLQRAGITYDTNGRMTKDDEGYTYVYNQQDELTKVIPPTGDTNLNYGYYADGLLSQRSDATANQEFFYNGGVVNSTSSGNPGKADQAWTSFLFNGGQRVAAYEQKQSPLYYLPTQGSTGATATAGASPVGMDYQAYGTQQASGQPSGNLAAHKNFTWNQEFVDPASRLVYLRSRFYNPRLMRFMTRDTTPLFNRYAFGNGDPINNIDPTGQFSIGDLFSVFGSAVIDAGEIVGGAAITACTFGGAEAVGGALMGAGVSGAVYTATHVNNFNWGSWGIEEGIGAGVGAITGGFGELADAPAAAAANAQQAAAEAEETAVASERFADLAEFRANYWEEAARGENALQDADEAGLNINDYANEARNDANRARTEAINARNEFEDANQRAMNALNRFDNSWTKKLTNKWYYKPAYNSIIGGTANMLGQLVRNAANHNNLSYHLGQEFVTGFLGAAVTGTGKVAYRSFRNNQVAPSLERRNAVVIGNLSTFTPDSHHFLKNFFKSLAILSLRTIWYYSGENF